MRQSLSHVYILISIDSLYQYLEDISTGLTREDVERMIESSISNSNTSSIDSDGIEELIRVSIEVALEPIKESVSELETYTRSQFAAVRDEIQRAISDRSIATEAVATIETTPMTTNNGDSLTFNQLATKLDYPVPEGVVVKSPGKNNANVLIAFAATLGQSYRWSGKRQKFDRIDAKLKKGNVSGAIDQCIFEAEQAQEIAQQVIKDLNDNQNTLTKVAKATLNKYQLL